MKSLLAMIISLGLCGVSYADLSGGEADTRAMFYFERPLAANAGQTQYTFGFRMDSGRVVEGGRWPLLNLQMRTGGATQLRLSGVPVFSYSEEASVRQIPGWAWVLGLVTAACIAEAGICEDDKQNQNQNPGPAEPCPTCG